MPEMLVTPLELYVVVFSIIGCSLVAGLIGYEEGKRSVYKSMMQVEDS